MKIMSLFSKKRFTLCFCLLCGLAYLGIVSRLVLDYTGNNGSLLIFFFFPAIVCGSALFIYKAIQNYLDLEAKNSLRVLFWGHVIVILLSIALVVEMIIL